jgi:hypothetical protein
VHLERFVPKATSILLSVCAIAALGVVSQRSYALIADTVSLRRGIDVFRDPPAVDIDGAILLDPSLYDRNTPPPPVAEALTIIVVFGGELDRWREGLDEWSRTAADASVSFDKGIRLVTIITELGDESRSVDGVSILRIHDVDQFARVTGVVAVPTTVVLRGATVNAVYNDWPGGAAVVKGLLNPLPARTWLDVPRPRKPLVPFGPVEDGAIQRITPQE